MNVLVTGGTGRIGSAVVEALNDWGARVGILCRSPSAAGRIEAMHAEPVAGDITDPRPWLGNAERYDAVVHAAATFDDQMGAVDSRLIAALLERLAERHRERILIYTGGVWVFGNTDGPGDESSPMDPPLAWRWMAENAARVATSRAVHGVVIHPAIVVADETGVPRILTEEAARTGTPQTPCAATATWPLVDRRDVAALYARALDGAPAGEAYIGASLPGVPVGRLAAIVGRQLGLSGETVEAPIADWMDRYGRWASGYALSQYLVSDKAREALGWQPGFALPD